MAHYCDIAPGHPYHGPYHDTEYGFPVSDETVLFERLCLEIFQAGLSWLTVLKKRTAMRAAFEGFVVDRVAGYGPADVERLLADPGIIRNKLKVAAIIHNAGVIAQMRVDPAAGPAGGFSGWLAAHRVEADGTRRSKESWVKLFKKTFKFTGGEITGEFLMSIAILPGAHRDDCPIAILLRERYPQLFET